jgi:hypothetical protein
MPKEEQEPSHFLPIPLRLSDPPKSIICRITGRDSLPLTIVATDGDSPFSTKRDNPAFTLKVVSKKTIHEAKLDNYEETDAEFQKILVDALFARGRSDIQLSAKISKRGDGMITVVYVIADGRFMYTSMVIMILLLGISSFTDLGSYWEF